MAGWPKGDPKRAQGDITRDPRGSLVDLLGHLEALLSPVTCLLWKIVRGTCTANDPAGVGRGTTISLSYIDTGILLIFRYFDSRILFDSNLI